MYLSELFIHIFAWLRKITTDIPSKLERTVLRMGKLIHQTSNSDEGLCDWVHVLGGSLHLWLTYAIMYWSQGVSIAKSYLLHKYRGHIFLKCLLLTLVFLSSLFSFFFFSSMIYNYTVEPIETSYVVSGFRNDTYTFKLYFMIQCPKSHFYLSEVVSSWVAIGWCDRVP